MKTFHRNSGHIAGSTMTIKELIQKLAEYPSEMPVFATWEGVVAYIEPHNFFVENVHKGNVTEALDCLLIDVEMY